MNLASFTLQSIFKLMLLENCNSLSIKVYFCCIICLLKKSFCLSLYFLLITLKLKLNLSCKSKMTKKLYFIYNKNVQMPFFNSLGFL